MTIQNLKTDLSINYRAVSNSDHQSYAINLYRFANFLDDSEVLKNKLLEMESKYPLINQHSMEYVNRNETFVRYNTIEENATLNWLIIKNLIIESKNIENSIIQMAISHFGCNESAHSYIYDHFNRNVVEPLYNYLLSSLNDTNLTLHTLIKYKHRSEWFKKKYLFNLYNSDTSIGEKNLNYDLYEYLFDQGIDIHIEPYSDSGRPDLIDSQKGNKRLIADGKIFDSESSRGKSYLVKGFNQVYIYSKTYNSSIGYLIIYKTCETDLILDFTKQEEATPYITHNGKTIFFIIIDLFPYEKSASKRGKNVGVILSEKELFAEIEN